MTPHNVGKEKVGLDFVALLQTASFAYSALQDRVNVLISEMREADIKRHECLPCERPTYLVRRRIAAENLTKVAANLEVAASTLSALEFALRRPVVEIINKPEVETED